ncbi:MAG: hypothetical protein KJ732_05550 [Candidatus Margulisbacteria bacterium]|nr:hypothetical protein [Candidatus Margulisiibacteriota bacterium]
MSFQLSADVPHDKLYAARFKPQAAEERQQQQQQQEQVAKQDPSLNNVQWVQQSNAAAQTTQVTANQNVDNGAVQAKPGDVSVATLGDEDLAVLSSSVSLSDKSAGRVSGRGFKMASFLGLNAAVIEESYRKYFRESRSHNLLLERFMSHVKFSAIKSLCSLIGVSLEEQVQIQSEVREEALGEIDNKLRQDWAYSKALLEIVG